jgi:hypothetical protein
MRNSQILGTGSMGVSAYRRVTHTYCATLLRTPIRPYAALGFNQEGKAGRFTYAYLRARLSSASCRST